MPNQQGIYILTNVLYLGFELRVLSLLGSHISSPNVFLFHIPDSQLYMK
jgi:hypothetical protein